MGQQQLLLIVLGVIIVGVAVVTGINLFEANARQAKMDELTSEVTNFAISAMQYYQKPQTMGGGGKRFYGWMIPGTSEFPQHSGSAVTCTLGTHVILYSYSSLVPERITFQCWDYEFNNARRSSASGEYFVLASVSATSFILQLRQYGF
jgi:outer membrane murein-binding lipoprotein Lpp